MGIIVKLEWKDKLFDLNNKTSGRYYLDEDFAPPRAGDLERGYSFNLIIKSAGSAETERALSNLQSFLDLAQDPHADLYLLYKDDDTIPFEPIYGQFGRFKRYKILPKVNAWENTVQQQQGSYHGGGNLGYKGTLLRNTVQLRIGAYSEGTRQVAAQGKGGILADWMGKEDGKPRGVVIPNTLTNKFTNPVFGSATAWDNNWTLGSGLQSKQIVGDLEPDRVFADRFSARLTNDSSVGQTRFVQSLNAGNTNAHILGCVAQLPDKTAPTESEITLFYNIEQTGLTIRALGDDGWYLIYKEITGIASAQDTGCKINGDATVYVDLFFLVETDEYTPPFYGDMLGCSWSGTRHDSTSTRAVSYARLPFNDVFNLGEGTIVIDWKPDFDESDLGGTNYWLFNAGSSAHRLTYSNTNSRFEFLDASNAANNTTKNDFSAGDAITLHCTYSNAGGIELYVNGTIGTGNVSYVAPTLPAWMYIGSSTTPNLWSGGAIQGLTVYDRALTQAQVTADYTARALLTAEDEATDPFPIMWTKDGDNILDNENDGSTDANWGVLLNVGGDQPALTEWLITPSYTSTLEAGTFFATYWNNAPVRAEKYLYPDLVYTDTTLFTSPSDYVGLITALYTGESFYNKIFFFFGATASDGQPNGMTGYWDWRGGPGGGQATARLETARIENTIPASGDPKLFVLGPLEIGALSVHPDRQGDQTLAWYMQIEGTDPTITTTHIQAMTGIVLKVQYPSATNTPNNYSMMPGKRVVSYDASGNPDELMYPEGDELIAVPHYYNVIQAIMGNNDTRYLHTDTQTITNVYLIPRFRIA